VASSEKISRDFRCKREREREREREKERMEKSLLCVRESWGISGSFVNQLELCCCCLKDDVQRTSGFIICYVCSDRESFILESYRFSSTQ
jgi:hypothetical protein